jgi:hypothetical protein
MLTNVQQDVHNIIPIGTFRNAFHKATLEIAIVANFDARKVSIKKYLPMPFSRCGKPKGP